MYIGFQSVFLSESFELYWVGDSGKKMCIRDSNNGERFETYIIKGERGSGKICLNGAAARKVQPDDIVIIMPYGFAEKSSGYSKVMLYYK